MNKASFNKFPNLCDVELEKINGGDNESYDFWYRVGRWVRGLFK